MPRYLLDTNILSDLVRNPAGRITRKIARLSPEDRQSICTSIIVAAELRFGCEKKESSRLSQRVAEILDSIEVLSFEPDAGRYYARLRASLERDLSSVRMTCSSQLTLWQRAAYWSQTTKANLPGFRACACRIGCAPEPDR